MTDETSAIFATGDYMARNVPHSAALGLEIGDPQPGRGVMRVPWREDLVGDPHTGALAGGVVTALLDHVCGYGVRAAIPDMNFPIATLDLRIDYMRASKKGFAVTAVAHCYKVTRSIAFVRAHAYDESPDDPIATAQAAFMLTRPEPA
ncbi:MAG TPA: PaaI family thioesterase [Caulobacterales bacterium]|jgi:uncharacterized protein (TIGR00369 family)|nr:PaaI family thioesterase [Caulobacterales bacterium]